MVGCEWWIRSDGWHSPKLYVMQVINFCRLILPAALRLPGYITQLLISYCTMLSSCNAICLMALSSSLIFIDGISYVVINIQGDLLPTGTRGGFVFTAHTTSAFSESIKILFILLKWHSWYICYLLISWRLNKLDHPVYNVSSPLDKWPFVWEQPKKLPGYAIVLWQNLGI